MKRINAIEWLRGFAALAIVLLHWLENSSKYGGAAVHAPLALRAGVDVFFVISGFVMYYTTRTAPPTAPAVTRFWWRRLVRIAPPYWLLTAVVVAAAVAGTGVTEYRFSASHALRSFAFIPAIDASGNLQPPLRVGWSLDYEVFFYLVFGLALLCPRRWRVAVLVIWASVSVAVGQLVAPANPIAATITSPLLLELAGGVVLGWWLIEHETVSLPGAPVFAILALAAFGVLERAVPGAPEVVKCGIPAVVLVGAAVAAERAQPAAFAWQPLARLGEWSYALYLTHGLTLAALGRTIARLHLGAAPAVVLIVAGVAVAIAAAAVFHHLIEKPVYQWLLRRTPRDSSSAAPVE